MPVTGVLTCTQWLTPRLAVLGMNRRRIEVTPSPLLGSMAPLVPPNRSGDGGTALAPPPHPGNEGMAEPRASADPWLTMAGMQDALPPDHSGIPSCPPCRRRFDHSDFGRLRSSCRRLLGGPAVAAMIKELSTIPRFEAQLLSRAQACRLGALWLSTEKMKNVNRILYLWGEPTRTLKSIYRRGYQTFMAQKTRSDHFEGSTFDANTAFWGVPKNLDEYANASHDTFEMQKHLESYLDAPITGSFLPKIAFLQIEKKTANLDRLANFLNLPEAELRAKLSPWEFASRAELAAEKELGIGSKHAASCHLSSAEMVAAVEDSIATIATTRMMSGMVAYSATISFDENFDLAHELAVKVNAKFINMRSLWASSHTTTGFS